MKSLEKYGIINLSKFDRKDEKNGKNPALLSGQRTLRLYHTGGDYKYNVSYEFTGLNEVKPRMIEEATKNARAAAEKFAKDSDSELGKIRNASQGQFSISDRDAYTPYIKSVRVVTTVNYYLKK